MQENTCQRQTTQKTPAKRKNHLKTAAKITISLTTLALVLHHSGPTTVLHAMNTMSIRLMAAAVSLFILSIYISSIRWKTLTPTKITTAQAFRLYMIGSFYNTILPGAVSGDAVRAYCLYKNGYDSGIATASVFTDRYIGFVALFTIAAAAFPFALPYLTGTALKLTFPLIALSFIACTAIMIIIKPGKRMRLISKFYEHMTSYSKSPRLIIKAYLISLPVQLSSILITYVISKGLGMNISIMHLCAIIPIIATITLIPISISGVGIREALYIMLLAPLGIDPAHATALSLTSFLATVIGSLPGMLLNGTPEEKNTDKTLPQPQPHPGSQPT